MAQPLCDDLQATLSGLSAIGTKVVQEGDALEVLPVSATEGRVQGMARFHANACAATLRMIIPICWALGQPARITMEDGLWNRPLEAYGPLAERVGGSLRRIPAANGLPAAVEVSGKLVPGEYVVDGSMSSQFASGLLMALSHVSGPARLMVNKPIVSRPYLDMTLKMVELFGGKVEEEAEGIFNILPIREQNPVEITIHRDWTQAAAFICANALGAGVMLEGLSMPKEDEMSLQGDEGILAVFRRMGLSFWNTQHGLYGTNPSRTRFIPLQADCSDMPDLAPFIALICTQAQGTSVLKGLKRLAVKECDRLSATVELLTRLGGVARVSEDGDAIIVEGATCVLGSAGLRGGITVDSRGDHRMVMLAAIAALIADLPVTVMGLECLSKSWPGFLEVYRSLGGIVS